jgi:hypothetical protein
MMPAGRRAPAKGKVLAWYWKSKKKVYRELPAIYSWIEKLLNT